MTLEEDIGDYLMEQLPELKLGRNLHYTEIQDSQTYGVTLTQTSSMDDVAVTWKGEFPRLQVDVRFSAGERSKAEVYDLSYKILNVLHMVLDTIINGTRYVCIQATGSPYYSGKDSNGRYKYTTVYKIVKEY